MKNTRRAFQRTVLPALGLCLYLAFSAIPLAAATLSEYRSGLASAEQHIDQLLDSVARSEGRRQDRVRESELISDIRRELPASQSVEWEGGSVVTRNDWIGERLEAFHNENDSTKRAVILTSIRERLEAISKKLEELEHPSTETRTKDEDKRKLADILRREEFQKPQVQEKSLFQKGLDKLLDWLSSIFPHANISPEESRGSGSLGFILQILVYSLVIAVIAFLVYKFAPFISGRFVRKPRKKQQERVILGERIAADESAEDVFADAERLALEGDLRGAIRKGYIAVLCELNDRKIIGLARNRTNRDYLRSVRQRRPLFDNLAGLTKNFERNWYGPCESVSEDWEDFRKGYRQTIASAGN